jgi:hypothetical protein
MAEPSIKTLPVTYKILSERIPFNLYVIGIISYYEKLDCWSENT